MNLNNFKEKRILVIGDIVLDKYNFGEVFRISPEAPVPVLKTTKTEYRLGGAANVAANIIALGGQVTLIGVIGKDEEAEKLTQLINNLNINFIPTFTEKTTLKTRHMDNKGHQLLRTDIENIEPKKITIPDLETDLIIISDYAKGVVTKDLFQQLEKFNKKIIIDPRPQNKDLYTSSFLITPNEQEALQITQTNDIKKAAESLKEKYQTNIIITRGSKGMLILPKQGEDIEIPTKAKEVYDVSGAGDTVVAALALALASDSTLEKAANIANHAAGIVIQKQGTSTVSNNELNSLLLKEETKIKTREELKDTLSKFQNKTIVWTNGCFDILHEGHVKYLKKAKALGDILVVGLNSDSSIKQLKGENKPYQSEKSRAEVLAALESVDFVTIFPETNVSPLLEFLKPHIYVKASDYDLEKMSQDERKTIDSYNGEIKFIEIEVDISTTAIADKIKRN